jgi:hypothetical protein
MKRTHAFLIAVALAIAVVAGTFAALRTTQLGANATPKISTTEFARQSRALDRAQAALRAELARKPPALSAVAPAQAQTVIYRRPAPIVHVIHRRGEQEAEGQGAGLDD